MYALVGGAPTHSWRGLRTGRDVTVSFSELNELPCPRHTAVLEWEIVTEGGLAFPFEVVRGSAPLGEAWPLVPLNSSRRHG